MDIKKGTEFLKLRKMLEENQIPFHLIHDKEVDETDNRIISEYYQIYYPNGDDPIFVVNDFSMTLYARESELTIYDENLNRLTGRGIISNTFTAEQAFEMIKNHFESREE